MSLKRATDLSAFRQENPLSWKRETDLFEYIQPLKNETCLDEQEFNLFISPKVFDRVKKETDLQMLGEKIESNSFLFYV